ncbi:MAG: PorV/PorQ family protein [Candidatus Goldbacteria bacterium]|nr:PorV/PorQ family protein [Candidatus Goldiibacteriota bacterium]
MRQINKCAALFLMFFICTAPVFSSGTTAGDFLLVDISAREAGLGGIYAPSFARPSASNANPAVLQGIQEKSAVFSHFTSVFGTNYEQFIYAQPIGIKDSISVSLMYDTNPELYRTNEEGYEVERIENYDITGACSYAREMMKDLNAGINVKFAFSKIHRSGNFGAVLNAGVLHKNFEQKYLIGASLENIGINSSYTKEKAMFPMLFRGGYGIYVYRNEGDVIQILAEERIFLVENEGAETSLGLEVTYRDFFTGRIGYVFGRQEGRVAIGAGVVYGQASIDYAYQPYFVADNAHRFTITFKF